jgi:AbrB family looped-hinge helix DNA binding protein
MLMKVFNKGQIVIPVKIRKELGISIGDKLEVHIDKKHKSIEINKPTFKSKILAGSLHKYAKNRSFPDKPEMREALIKGLTEKYENKTD